MCDILLAYTHINRHLSAKRCSRRQMISDAQCQTGYLSGKDVAGVVSMNCSCWIFASAVVTISRIVTTFILPLAYSATSHISSAPTVESDCYRGRVRLGLHSPLPNAPPSSSHTHKRTTYLLSLRRFGLDSIHQLTARRRATNKRCPTRTERELY